MELQAQAVELLSILASKHRTKEPRKVQRPEWVSGDETTSQQTSSRNPFSSAIDRVLAVGAPRRSTEGEYVGTPPAHLREAVR